MTEVRMFNRCIALTRLPKSKYKPLQGFLRGGQSTAWPWWQFRVGRIELSVSRTRPRERVPSTDTTDGTGS